LIIFLGHDRWDSKYIRSNLWFYGREIIGSWENPTLKHGRRPATRTKNVECFTAHVDRVDPAVNNDIRLGWYSILTCEKKFCAFSRSGTLFHMCEHLTKQWSSGLVRRAFRLELGPCALLWHNRFSEQRSFISENKMSWKVVKVYLRSI